jgi:hypothetical protein
MLKENKMNTVQKIELIKSWGFKPAGHNLFERSAPSDHIEYYSPLKPDHIDFHNAVGEFMHDYKVNWSLF